MEKVNILRKMHVVVYLYLLVFQTILLSSSLFRGGLPNRDVNALKNRMNYLIAIYAFDKREFCSGSNG